MENDKPEASSEDAPGTTNESAKGSSIDKDHLGEPGSQLDGEAPAPKRSRRKQNIIILIVVLVVAAGLAGFFTWRHYQNGTIITTAKTKKLSSQVADAQPATSDALLQTPQQVQNLGLFSNYDTYFGKLCANTNCSQERPTNSSDLTYYNIGKFNGEPIIVVRYSTESPGGPGTIVALQTGAGKYSILAKYTDGLNDGSGYDALASFSKTLASNVSVDQATDIPELDFPASIKVNNLELAASDLSGDNSYAHGYFLPNGLADIRSPQYAKVAVGTQPVKIDNIGGRDIYEVTAINSANYQSKEWYATQNQVWAANYIVADSLNSPTDYKGANPPPVKINWTSGQNNSSAYGRPFVSCGTNGYMVAKNITRSDLTAIGTGPEGQTVYALPNSSPLLNELYSNDYKNTESSISNKSLQNLSLQQFQDDHAVIVSVNPLGELVVHVRSEMFLGGGCGKPVIYLYPTKLTSISVKVGAEVVKSDPPYSTNSGWQNILARPDGQLIYQAGSYDSLFWEGYGNGRYPEITSGTVVKSSQAPATIRKQLREQGLNTREINDFMDFWQPRLPHTPYVCLTWLGTSQMQQIAPLTILPQPNTLIRVFLDFKGLEQPIQLAPQHFSAPPRQGFTVVEWGGLLRDGIR